MVGDPRSKRHAGPGWSHGEKSATDPKTRAKGVGERPLSRFAARANHARGLRRLRFTRVRADVPHGQEDPEEDGHESALRLPKLPAGRAIPAVRGSGRGRRVRVLAGQVLGNARFHVRRQSADGGLHLHQHAAEAGLDLLRFRREMRAHIHSESIRDIREGAVRSGVASAPAFFINSIRHESSFGLATLLAAVQAASAA